MMWLDTEAVMRRAAMIVAATVFGLGLAVATWYNFTLETVVGQTKITADKAQQYTLYLDKVTTDIKQDIDQKSHALVSAVTANQAETKRTTEEIKQDVVLRSRDLQTSVQNHKQELRTELKKLEDDLKQQTVMMRQLSIDLEKQKTEFRTVIQALTLANTALGEQIKIKEYDLRQEIQRRDQDLENLNSKLAKEIEHRNRYWYSR